MISSVIKIILFSLAVGVTGVLGSPALEKPDAWTDQVVNLDNQHQAQLILDAWSDQVVNLHNQHRAQYGASAVTWSSSQYASTLSYAKNCKFTHSDSQGRYGENLYAGTGSVGIKDALQSWMNEASKYDYNKPGFSSGTGHFTQVVWKSTKQVTCAIANCPAGTIFSSASHFIVCRYMPPGNYKGQFPQNVGRHI